MLNRFIFMAVLALSLQACETNTTPSVAASPDTSPATPFVPVVPSATTGAPPSATEIHNKADQVLVASGDLPGHKYTPLGYITASAHKFPFFGDAPDQGTINQALREKAATMGADAVLFVHYSSGEHDVPRWSQMYGDGLAVKLAVVRNALTGRVIDTTVIGQRDIPLPREVNGMKPGNGDIIVRDIGK